MQPSKPSPLIPVRVREYDSSVLQENIENFLKALNHLFVNDKDLGNTIVPIHYTLIPVLISSKFGQRIQGDTLFDYNYHVDYLRQNKKAILQYISFPQSLIPVMEYVYEHFNQTPPPLYVYSTINVDVDNIPLFAFVDKNYYKVDSAEGLLTTNVGYTESELIKEKERYYQNFSNLMVSITLVKYQYVDKYRGLVSALFGYETQFHNLILVTYQHDHWWPSDYTSALYSQLYSALLKTPDEKLSDLKSVSPYVGAAIPELKKLKKVPLNIEADPGISHEEADSTSSSEIQLPEESLTTHPPPTPKKITKLPVLDIKQTKPGIIEKIFKMLMMFINGQKLSQKQQRNLAIASFVFKKHRKRRNIYDQPAYKSYLVNSKK